MEPAAVAADPGMATAMAMATEEEGVAAEAAAPTSFGAFAALNGAVETAKMSMRAAMWRIVGCRSRSLEPEIRRSSSMETPTRTETFNKQGEDLGLFRSKSYARPKIYELPLENIWSILRTLYSIELYKKWRDVHNSTITAALPREEEE